MTFLEGLTHLPLWVRVWIAVLLFSIVVLPVALLVWRQSRLAAVLILTADGAAGFGVSRLYDAMGYVKLLGLPHIIFWVPLVIYLFTQLKRTDLPLWPRRIIAVVLAMLLVSLAFDCTDVARYLLGERTPLFSPP